jgi:hypothetical protein
MLEYASVREIQLLQKKPHIMDYLLRVMSMLNEAVSRRQPGMQDTANDVFASYFAKLDYRIPGLT